MSLESTLLYLLLRRHFINHYFFNCFYNYAISRQSLETQRMSVFTF